MHNKRNNKESKTYVQGLRVFGNTLPRGLKGILKKSGFNYSEIIGKWNTLVGKEIGNYCYPKSIKMRKGTTNGILVLSVKRGNEIIIEYSKKEIINKINSYFGYQLINEIKLQTLNIENKKKKNDNKIKNLPENYKNKINQIKNENIRNSLFELTNVMKK
jgi:hypothetical protein